MLQHASIALAASCLRAAHLLLRSWPLAMFAYGVASTLLSTALGLSLKAVLARARSGVRAGALLFVALVELSLFIALIVGTHGFSRDEPDLHGVRFAWVADLSRPDPLRLMPMLVLVVAVPSLWFWARRTHPTRRGIAFQALIAGASAFAATLSSAASGIGLIGRSIGGPLLLVLLWALRTPASRVVGGPTVVGGPPVRC